MAPPPTSGLAHPSSASSLGHRKRLERVLGHLAAGAAPARRATAEAATSVGDDDSDDDAATEALQHFLNTGISWDEPVPRLEIGSAAAAEHLAEHGFVVLRSALSAADCETALSLIWDSLEGFGSGIDRHDAQTWTNDRWPGQGQTGSGLTGVRGDYGLTHCEGSWFVRTRPGVIKAHAALFRTDDLLASFDGLALTRPWGLNPEHRPEQGLHWDRGWNPDDPEHVQYQGFVNLLPTTPTTGGNVVLAGMHRQYRAIMEGYCRAGGESPKGPHPHHLLRDRPELFIHKAINPHMEAGDLCECDTIMFSIYRAASRADLSILVPWAATEQRTAVYQHCLTQPSDSDLAFHHVACRHMGRPSAALWHGATKQRRQQRGRSAEGHGAGLHAAALLRDGRGACEPPPSL